MANTKVYKTSAGPPSPPSSSIACLVLLLLMMMLIVGRSVGRMRTSYSPLASSPLLHKYMLHFVTNRILFLSPSCHVRVPRKAFFKIIIHHKHLQHNATSS
ncbi:hypothetical protein BLOT_002995 [Blomia tropicalis]|nr:hypothetical protein BLOT_002995 [Blomia tropicalis]